MTRRAPLSLLGLRWIRTPALWTARTALLLVSTVHWGCMGEQFFFDTLNVVQTIYLNPITGPEASLVALIAKDIVQ